MASVSYNYWMQTIMLLSLSATAIAIANIAILAIAYISYSGAIVM